MAGRWCPQGATTPARWFPMSHGRGPGWIIRAFTGCPPLARRALSFTRAINFQNGKTIFRRLPYNAAIGTYCLQPTVASRAPGGVARTAASAHSRRPAGSRWLHLRGHGGRCERRRCGWHCAENRAGGSVVRLDGIHGSRNAIAVSCAVTTTYFFPSPCRYVIGFANAFAGRLSLAQQLPGFFRTHGSVDRLWHR